MDAVLTKTNRQGAEIGLKSNRAYRLTELRFCLCLFIGLTVINYFTPLTGDDMTFYGLSSTMSLSEIGGFVAGYGNGRFLGNLLIMLFVRNTFLRAMFKSFIITGITLLNCRLLGLKSLLWLSLSAILTVIPGTEFVARVYTWSAGFMNYVPPVFLMLLCLYLIKTFNERKWSLSYLFACVTIALSGVCAQLFCENSSVFHVLVSGGIVIYLAVKNRRVPSAVSICWLASTAVGGLIMLILPSFIEKSNDLSWYRHTSFEGSDSFIKTAFTNYSTICNRVFCCLPLWIVISLCLLIYMKSHGDYEDTPAFARRMCSGILISYPTFNLVLYLVYAYDGSLSYFVRFLEVALLTSYLGVCYLVLARFSPEGQRTKLFVLLTGAVVSLLPLLVVSPIGTRTVYLGYAVMAVFALYLANDALGRTIPKKHLKAFGQVAAVGIFMCCLGLFISYCEVYEVYTARNEYIEAQIEKGSTRIVIPALPHRELVYDAEKDYRSSKKTFEGLCAMFYDEEPGDVYFKVYKGSYQEWLSAYKNKKPSKK